MKTGKISFALAGLNFGSGLTLLLLGVLSNPAISMRYYLISMFNFAVCGFLVGVELDK